MTTQNSAQAEATNSSVEVHYDGETYTVAPAREWDLDVLEAYENGMIATTVKVVLGAEQYERFRSVKRTVGDLEDLFLEIQSALGVEGN
jgi:hypothetical protein